ncbi:hypothetical protein ACFE04_023352 [Oxalis oulophora]
MDLIEDKRCYFEYQGERRLFISAASLVIMILSMITRAFFGDYDILYTLYASSNALLILFLVPLGPSMSDGKGLSYNTKAHQRVLGEGVFFQRSRVPIISMFTLFENNSDTTNYSTPLSCRCDQIRAQKEDMLPEQPSCLADE